MAGTAEVNGRLWGTNARDWSELQEPLLKPVYEETFRRSGLRARQTYLDVGCGSGLAAQLAAARGATVHGVDASEPLLDIARRRVPNGSFYRRDIEEPGVPVSFFDLVTGFNSFQFAADPLRALRAARNAAKPAGTIVLVTWGPPEDMPAAELVGALRALMPPPPAGAPGPFALSDEARLRALARTAGLSPVEVFDVDCPFVYPDLATGLRGMRSSGVAARAVANSSIEAVDDAHRAVLERYRRPDGAYEVRSTFRCLMARPD